jgi:hypothetical protein
MEALGHSLVLLKIKTKPIYYTSNLDLDAWVVIVENSSFIACKVTIIIIIIMDPISNIDITFTLVIININ